LSQEGLFEVHSYRYVGIASEIQAGKSKSFSISDERGKSIDVAVFNIDGQFYAISNTIVHYIP
jgi:nitrite reductase/ring-hydroxylating ferredoxin subunit